MKELRSKKNKIKCLGGGWGKCCREDEESMSGLYYYYFFFFILQLAVVFCWSTSVWPKPGKKPQLQSFPVLKDTRIACTVVSPITESFIFFFSPLLIFIWLFCPESRDWGEMAKKIYINKFTFQSSGYSVKANEHLCMSQNDGNYFSGFSDAPLCSQESFLTFFLI